MAEEAVTIAQEIYELVESKIHQIEARELVTTHPHEGPEGAV
jgi:hypothetical protein